MNMSDHLLFSLNSVRYGVDAISVSELNFEYASRLLNMASSERVHTTISPSSVLLHTDYSLIIGFFNP